MPENDVSPKIEIERKENPRLDEIDDRIADLVAEALYNHILRKGLLKTKSESPAKSDISG